MPAQAATIAEKLKSTGATSVVFAGDPIMPIYLTKACANIGYFPEWIITGIVLTDTSTLGRYFDQQEWAHAFGVTSLAVPVPVAAGDADHLYHWWYGANTSPASPAAPAIIPPISQFFAGVQLPDPYLTPSNFTTGLFRAPPAGGGSTSPLLAYGYQGAAPLPSYSSPADYTPSSGTPAAKGFRRGGPEQGQRADALRPRRGGYKAVCSSPSSRADVLPTGRRLELRVAARRARSYPPWPGSPAACGKLTRPATGDRRVRIRAPRRRTRQCPRR